MQIRRMLCDVAQSWSLERTAVGLVLRDDDSPLGLVASLALVLLAPIAATIIQLAISRQREGSPRKIAAKALHVWPRTAVCSVGGP